MTVIDFVDGQTNLGGEVWHWLFLITQLLRYYFQSLFIQPLKYRVVCSLILVLFVCLMITLIPWAFMKKSVVTNCFYSNILYELIVTASLSQASLFKTLSYLDHESVMGEFLRTILWCIPLNPRQVLRAGSALNSEPSSDPILKPQRPELMTDKDLIRAFKTPRFFSIDYVTLQKNWTSQFQWRLLWSSEICDHNQSLFSGIFEWIHINYGLIHGGNYLYSTTVGEVQK